MRKKSFILLMLLFSTPAFAAIHTENIQYKDGETVLEGYLAYNDAVMGERPGVLIIHDWMGLRDFAKKRAEDLAALGYTAFAADIYGKDVRPENPAEAGAQAGIYKKDRLLARSRAQAALKVLENNSFADKSRIAAMGYCFGGMVALELARSGAEIEGVVSFHGSLDTPKPEETVNVKGKVLVLHGADDPHVPPKDVENFENEMRQAKADWQLVSYGGAVHAFTNPEAGNDASQGAAYNESADKRSWRAMKDFLNEIFA